MPASHETVEQRLHYVKQDGRPVFKFAVTKTEEIARRLLERNDFTRRRRRPVRVASGQPPHHRGAARAARARPTTRSSSISNATATRRPATIPLALADARAEGRLKKGDLVLLASVGAGFTVGSVLLRWSL